MIRLRVWWRKKKRNGKVNGSNESYLILSLDSFLSLHKPLLNPIQPKILGEGEKKKSYPDFDSEIMSLSASAGIENRSFPSAET